MASLLPASGANHQYSITVDGAGIPVAGQVDGGSAKQEVSEMVHRPTGTMDVAISQDLGGWSGDLSTKSGNAILHTAIDLIEVSVRVGRKPVVVVTETVRYPDGSSVTHAYMDCVITLSQTVKRGEHTGVTVTWRSGKARISV